MITTGLYPFCAGEEGSKIAPSPFNVHNVFVSRSSNKQRLLFLAAKGWIKYRVEQIFMTYLKYVDFIENAHS